MLNRSIFSTLSGSARGAVLIEFALALPLLLVLLMGILAYGQYIWIAHAAQEVANDAARAALAGVTPAERTAIARGVLDHAVANLPEVRQDKASIEVAQQDQYLLARVTVDASAVTLLHTGFVPLPSPVIDRRAIVRLEPAL